jgi:hypothetical protein
MAWYKCIKTNQYTGRGKFVKEKFYELEGVPPVQFFTPDDTEDTRRKDYINFFDAERDAEGDVHVYDDVEFEEDVSFTKNVFFDNIAGDAGIQKHVAWNSGNGILTWDSVTQASATTVDIGAGTVRFTDGDSTDPQISYVEFDAVSGVTDSFVATNLRTFWAVDRNGDIQQFADKITSEEKRDHVQIFVTSHATLTQIDVLSPSPEIGYEIGNKLIDLQDAIKIVNFNGSNVYSGAAGVGDELKLAKTGGTCWANTGRNWMMSTVSPMVTEQAALSAIEGAPSGFPLLFDAWRDGSGGTAIVPNLTGVLDTTKYDDGSGTLATLGDGFWVTHRLYMEPSQNITIRFYGQTPSKGKVQELQAINLKDFDPPELTQEYILRGAVTHKKGVTSLDGNDDVIFSRADKYGTIIVNSLGGNTNLGVPVYQSEFFTSRGVNAGTYYLFGYYLSAATDITLTDAAGSFVFGSTNAAYGARPFAVFAGDGTVDSGQVGLRATGTTITDSGVRTASDTQVITTDITAPLLDSYLETTKKFIGAVTYELYVVSGSPATYSVSFNYGLSAYEDFGNRDFMLTDFDVKGLGGINDAAAEIVLLHHKTTGWTYSAAGFEPGNGEILSLNSVYGAEDQIYNGEPFRLKLDETALNTPILGGSGDEGFILRVVAGQNNTYQFLNAKPAVQF